MDGRHTLFYDGSCGLCDRSVQLVLAHDRADRFRFAPLQGAYAVRTLGERGIKLGPDAPLETVYVLTADGRLLDRSDAALFIASQLTGWPSVGRLLRVVPRAVRELGYRFVAEHRHRWFEAGACHVPSGVEREKFIVDS